MDPESVEMLSALFAADAEFLVVGSHALAAHGVPRATGDLDLWVRGMPENARKVLVALAEYLSPRREAHAEQAAGRIRGPGTPGFLQVPGRK